MPTGWLSALKHFENAPHDAVAPLDRADRDRCSVPIAMMRGAIAGLGQFALQRLRRIGLGEQLGLEIEPGRQAEKGVGRPRKAIDAAVLAAPIGIDRPVEADIRGFVPGDDAPRRDLLHLGRAAPPSRPATPSRRRPAHRLIGSKRPERLVWAPRPWRRPYGDRRPPHAAGSRSRLGFRRATLMHAI